MRALLVWQLPHPGRDGAREWARDGPGERQGRAGARGLPPPEPEVAQPQAAQALLLAGEGETWG